MSTGYTVFLNGQIEIEGQTHEISFGLSGQFDRHYNVWDLAFDEVWLEKYFNPDLFRDEFINQVKADMEN